MSAYECDKCGACCNGSLIVEAYRRDAKREPRILKRQYGTITLKQLGQGDGRCLLLACGTSKPCKSLGADNLCSIYTTRPDTCREFEAGDSQCQEVRERNGLPRLEKKKR